LGSLTFGGLGNLFITFFDEIFTGLGKETPNLGVFLIFLLRGKKLAYLGVYFPKKGIYWYYISLSLCGKMGISSHIFPGVPHF